MKNIDEKIARFKLRQRIESENKEKSSENIEINEPNITIEEVIEQMKMGKVTIEDKTISFKEETFLNGLLTMNIPIGYMEEKVNKIDNVSLVNDTIGLSFVASVAQYKVTNDSFNKFKIGLEKQFKDGGLYLEWIEEGTCGIDDTKLPYGIYKTSTGSGILYNLIFYRAKKNSMLIGNYNFFEKDLATWKLLIKASVMLMKVK